MTVDMIKVFLNNASPKEEQTLSEEIANLVGDLFDSREFRITSTRAKLTLVNDKSPLKKIKLKEVKARMPTKKEAAKLWAGK